MTDTKISDERLADEFAAVLHHIEEGDFYADYDRASSSLGVLRQAATALASRHQEPVNEPVATMHTSETETLFSKGWNGRDLMGFTSTPLYAAPQPAPVVTDDEAVERFDLEWDAAPRPPAHPKTMVGMRSFPSLEKAVHFVRSLPPDAKVVSLLRTTSTFTDVTETLTAALQKQESGE